MGSRSLIVALAFLGLLGLDSGAAAVPARPFAALSPPSQEQAWVGRVLAPVTARTAPRRSAPARTVVQPIAPFAQGPTVLLVTRSRFADGTRWAEVLLPIRPNGSRGWIPVDVLDLRTTPVRVSIDISDRRLTVTRAGRRTLRAPIAVGAPTTPTPIGRWFAVAELVRTRTPGAFLGPIVLPLTGYSQTLNEFAGGDGRVAIHGTSLPELIGSAVSHGCVRMRNVDVVRVARSARPGTPVTIRA